MRPFVVFSLPRSRSAWIGAFLTYKDWVCLHNISLALVQVQDLNKVLARPKTGLADTSLAMLWPEIVDRRPDARIVTVRRPLHEVIEAQRQQGLDVKVNEPILRRIDYALNEIESLTGILRLEYSDLTTEAGCQRLFEFCLPYKFDQDWWHCCKDVIVEQDPRLVQAKLMANAKGFFQTFSQASHYYDKRLAEQVR